MDRPQVSLLPNGIGYAYLSSQQQDLVLVGGDEDIDYLPGDICSRRSDIMLDRALKFGMRLASRTTRDCYVNHFLSVIELEVDGILARGPLRLAWDNLESICAICI